MEPTTLRIYVRRYKYCRVLACCATAIKIHSILNCWFSIASFQLEHNCVSMWVFLPRSQLLAGAQVPIYSTNIDVSVRIQCETINFFTECSLHENRLWWVKRCPFNLHFSYLELMQMNLRTIAHNGNYTRRVFVHMFRFLMDLSVYFTSSNCQSFRLVVNFF